MEENEEIKIDFDELKKQRDKDIQEKGEYLRVEILISNSELCIPSIEMKRGNILMVARMLEALEAVKQTLIEEYPDSELISNHLIKTTTATAKRIKKPEEEEQDGM